MNGKMKKLVLILVMIFSVSGLHFLVLFVSGLLSQSQYFFYVTGAMAGIIGSALMGFIQILYDNFDSNKRKKTENKLLRINALKDEIDTINKILKYEDRQKYILALKSQILKDKEIGIPIETETIDTALIVYRNILEVQLKELCCEEVKNAV